MVFGSKRNSTTGNPHPNKITIQDNTNTATMKKSPFFASPSPEPVVEQQKLGFFGRKNSLARKGDQNIDSSSSSEKRGLLGGRKSVDSPERRTSGGGGGFFNFSKQDSLKAAQTKLNIAIEAEKAADAALIASRKAVKDARAEIAALEREAHIESKAAHAKVKAAKSLHKQGDKLGRHE